MLQATLLRFYWLIRGMEDMKNYTISAYFLPKLCLPGQKYWDVECEYNYTLVLKHSYCVVVKERICKPEANEDDTRHISTSSY